MRGVICQYPAKDLNEFVQLKQTLVARYPNYERLGFDDAFQIDIEISGTRFLNVFIIDDCRFTGKGMIGFFIMERDQFHKYSLLSECTTITSKQLQDILNFKNPYTFRGKKFDSLFRLNLNVTIQERTIYA